MPSLVARLRFTVSLHLNLRDRASEEDQPRLDFSGVKIVEYRADYRDGSYPYTSTDTALHSGRVTSISPLSTICASFRQSSAEESNFDHIVPPKSNLAAK
ncbi:hypothetical protein CCUS01_06846 [Colletotrichum cuscutae]|uniref:Uncharacterized protein n=1 Tax=Colletotrichum cuscutae TaxID=1209917 RepID=A0AAI9XXQ5_9PEZI|nr:hypothetical protein CCUS01_06846 [Colletotrichum cuscutae]